MRLPYTLYLICTVPTYGVGAVSVVISMYSLGCPSMGWPIFVVLRSALAVLVWDGLYLLCYVQPWLS